MLWCNLVHPCPFKETATSTDPLPLGEIHVIVLDDTNVAFTILVPKRHFPFSFPFFEVVFVKIPP